MDMNIVQQMLKNQAMSAMKGKAKQHDVTQSLPRAFQQLLNKAITGQISADQTPVHSIKTEADGSMIPEGAQKEITENHPASSFDTSIENSSEKYGVDKSLVHAVINTESGYDPDALSDAGAQGMMQLMPATAEGLGVENPYDPEQNIEGGTKYLRHMLDKYNGNTELALAAYNAGPGNIDTHQGIPPYEETRNYVEDVIGDYRT